MLLKIGLRGIASFSQLPTNRQQQIMADRNKAPAEINQQGPRHRHYFVIVSL